MIHVHGIDNNDFIVIVNRMMILIEITYMLIKVIELRLQGFVTE